MINASLRRLSVFKTVYELRGVNAAADHLDISQPSVTAHIQALESELATSLFIRHRGRKLRPTDSGETLYRYTLQVLAASREARDSLDKLQKLPENLTLGVQRTISTHIMEKVLAQFLGAHPGTEISVHSETQEGLAGLLREQSVDIGIMFWPVEAPGYDLEILGEERLAIIAAPSHPLAHSRSIAPATVQKHGFVGPIRRSQFFSLIDDELRRIGLENRCVVLSLQDTVSVKQAVVQGMGLACTLLSSCREEIENGLVVLLDLDAPPMSLSVQCSFRSHCGLPGSGRDLVQFLRDSRIWRAPRTLASPG